MEPGLSNISDANTMSLCATFDGTKSSASWDKLQEQLVQNRDMDRYGSQNKTILLGHHLQNLLYSVLLDVVYQ